MGNGTEKLTQSSMKLVNPGVAQHMAECHTPATTAKSYTIVKLTEKKMPMHIFNLSKKEIKEATVRYQSRILRPAEWMGKGNSDEDISAYKNKRGGKESACGKSQKRGKQQILIIKYIR